MGLQRGFSQQIPEGIPTNIKLLPEYLKTIGYKTHMFGKWHLGFCNEKYTPVKRGFDSFQGRYTALEKQEKLDRLKHDLLDKTSTIRKNVNKNLKTRLNKIKKQSKKQEKAFLNENQRYQKSNKFLKKKSKRQRMSNKKRNENYKELLKELKQTRRKMYRNFSRKTKRSVKGLDKRPQDMESSSYMQQVAEILRSYSNNDTYSPFFIFISFFTKSYRSVFSIDTNSQTLIFSSIRSSRIHMVSPSVCLCGTN